MNAKTEKGNYNETDSLKRYEAGITRWLNDKKYRLLKESVTCDYASNIRFEEARHALKIGRVNSRSKENKGGKEHESTSLRPEHLEAFWGEGIMPFYTSLGLRAYIRLHLYNDDDVNIRL